MRFDLDHRSNLRLSPTGALWLMVYWILAILIMVALIAAAVFLVIDLARLPGEIAARRGHPHADAVRIAGVIGIFTGILWILALIWAHVPYPSQAAPIPHDAAGPRSQDKASPVAEGPL